MIEIPESIVLAEQIDRELKNKRIRQIIAGLAHHSFAWYNGNPSEYSELYRDKVIFGSCAYGGKLHIKLSQDCGFMFCDGANLRYYTDKKLLPKKHQLCIEFDDSTYLVCTIMMYGGIFGYSGLFENGYDRIAKTKPQILSEDFNMEYFRELLAKINNPKLSAKAFLSTEQRIPGFGNGVLQDVLFNARINPKRSILTLSMSEFENLFKSIKETILDMTSKGGRDVETDLYGKSGGYKTKMSKNTFTSPCPVCNGPIKKEAYYGGSVYYCSHCQI